MTQQDSRQSWQQTETVPGEQQTTQTVDGLLQNVADRTGLDVSKIHINRDMGQVLQYMQEGIIINLHVKRPRFTCKLTQGALGLCTTSSEAQSVINKYFQLGRQSILPEEYRDMLDTAEQNARFNLKRYSVKTHWGMFVPLNFFEDWQREDERFHLQFDACKEAIITNYRQIVSQVVDEYRPLAEDAWKRMAFGDALYQGSATKMEREIMAEVTSILHYENGKDAFIENYLATVQASFPTLMEIEQGFLYEPEPSFVPLPSVLARDNDEASRIITQQAVDREREALQIQRERELSDSQLRMEQYVLESARRQRDELITEFYNDIISQINTYLAETCKKVLGTIERNGTLRGPSSDSLFILVDRLQKMNFINNADVEDQIARIRAVLPTQEERTRAGKGIAKIDVSRITRTLQEIHQQVSEVVIEIDTEPRVRRVRKDPEIGAITLDTPKRHNNNFTLSGGDQQQETVEPTKKSRKWDL